jgi:hypothetical protein
MVAGPGMANDPMSTRVESIGFAGHWAARYTFREVVGIASDIGEIVGRPCAVVDVEPFNADINLGPIVLTAPFFSDIGRLHVARQNERGNDGDERYHGYQLEERESVR